MRSRVWQCGQCDGGRHSRASKSVAVGAGLSASAAGQRRCGTRSQLYPQVREVLLESHGRVRAIGLLHEKLYRAHDLARVDMDDYVRGLTTELLRTYGGAEGAVHPGRHPGAVDDPPSEEREAHRDLAALPQRGALRHGARAGARRRWFEVMT
mgnify:CR=1 FL=1